MYRLSTGFLDAERSNTGDYDWMYFFIDNIRIDEQYTHDLAVEDFTGPATLTLGGLRRTSFRHIHGRR